MNSYALIIPMFIIHHKMILRKSSKQDQSKYGPLKKVGSGLGVMKE